MAAAVQQILAAQAEAEPVLAATVSPANPLQAEGPPTPRAALAERRMAAKVAMAMWE